MGALFFGLIIVMFNGFFEMTMVVLNLPVYYKQREKLFFPAWAYSIPSIILGIPFSLIDSLIWVCLTYYVIGFAPEPERFVESLQSGIYLFLSMLVASPLIDRVR